MKLPSLLLTMFVFSLGVQGIVFDLPTGKFKCVMEEVRQVQTLIHNHTTHAWLFHIDCFQKLLEMFNFF